jgi:putative transcription factor
MNCELCGLSDTTFYKTQLDGAVMFLCHVCAKYGKVIEEIDESTDKSRIKKNKNLNIYAEKEIKIDYSKILSDALSEKSISIEQLASEIKESPYELKKIVSGKLLPQDSIALKLEKALGVSLYDEVNNSFSSSKEEEDEFPLGDVADIKKKNK